MDDVIGRPLYMHVHSGATTLLRTESAPVIAVRHFYLSEFTYISH